MTIPRALRFNLPDFPFGADLGIQILYYRLKGMEPGWDAMLARRNYRRRYARNRRRSR